MQEIYIPQSENDYLVRATIWEGSRWRGGYRGPRCSRTVALICKKICDEFSVELSSLTWETTQEIDQRQTQRVYYPENCPCDDDFASWKRPESCRGAVHGSGESHVHYRYVTFPGSANYVSARLRKWFDTISRGSSLEKVASSLTGSLEGMEDRVGLTDFMKGT